MLSRKIVLGYFVNLMGATVKDPRAVPYVFSRLRRLSVLPRVEKKRLRTEKELDIPVPGVCSISVTWKCNLNCKGCYASNYSGAGGLSLDEIRQVISETNRLGTFVYWILGGEPLLVPGLVDMLSEFKEAFFFLVTNGTLLDSTHVRELGRAGGILPVISMEGDRESTDHRRGEAVGEKVASAMKTLKEAHVPFGFSAMITHQNCKAVTSRQWFDDMWKRGARFGYMIDYVPLKHGLEPTFVLTDDDRAIKSKALEKRRAEGRPLIYNLPPDEYKLFGQCMSAGRGFMHINADGFVEPCVFTHYAVDNIRDTPIVEILSSEFFSSLRNELSHAPNPKGECQLFANSNRVKSIAKRTGAFCTEARTEDEVVSQDEDSSYGDALAVSIPMGHQVPEGSLHQTR